jgi:hypothetical protein
VGNEVMGGAVVIWSGSAPQFIDCVFVNNVVEDPEGRLRLGGAVWSVASDPVFLGCEFRGNHAAYGGGLGWWNRSLPRVEECRFLDNQADEGGGGLFGLFREGLQQLDPLVLRSSVFLGNRARLGGGLLVSRNLLMSIENCLFAGNFAAVRGGGLMTDDGARILVSTTTIAHNEVLEPDPDAGAGIQIGDNASLEIDDSIIAYNQGGPGIAYQGPSPDSAVRVSYCDLHGNSGGAVGGTLSDPVGSAGNIAADPRFVSGEENEYYLSEPETGDPVQIELGPSPCRDAGSRASSETFLAGRSTRTDHADDRETLDMGYHGAGQAPYLIPLAPRAGSSGVPNWQPLSLVVPDDREGVSKSSITVEIPGVASVTSLSPAYRGYAILVDHELFADCADVEVRVTALDLAPTPHTLANPTFRFQVEGCTATPTPAADTPTPTPGPPTPTPPPALRLRLFLNAHEFTGGDPLQFDIELLAGSEAIALDLYLALDIAGEFYFYPLWTQTPAATRYNLAPLEVRKALILNLTLPSPLTPGGPFVFYGLGLDPETAQPLHELQQVQFRFI